MSQRTNQPAETRSLVVLTVEKGDGRAIQNASPNVWGVISKHVPNIVVFKTICGPLKLRRILQISQTELSVALAAFMDMRRRRTYTRGTMSACEIPERFRRRRKKLPYRYWSKRWMPDHVIEAFHAMIVWLVDQFSGGEYRARVTGKRIWRVQLRRTA
ncbi:MAG: hypothetical protein M1546_16260 [Chloroflexi bacterium]|nr:hypothetical protein [Chloroflexota bacterium]